MKSEKDKIGQNRIWENIIKGNTEAYERLYKEYAHMLYVYGLKFTSNKQIVEDCIHELFAGIIQNHHKLCHTDNANIYLIRSFRNNIIRMLSREKKYTLTEVENYQFEVYYSVEKNIIETEEDQSRQKILSEALNGLTPRQKEAVYLRYNSGLEYEEIAGIMQISTEACRNIICKSIKSLREKIDSVDEEDCL